MAKPINLLLIEDNLDDEQLSVRQLRKVRSCGWIEVSRDGEMALTRLMDPELPLPDLVLLDLKLPKINGLELLHRLRMNARTANLRIIVLSAPDEPGDVRATYRQFADGFIEKPVMLEAFVAEAARLGIVSLNASVI